jgi:urease accessory protein
MQSMSAAPAAFDDVFAANRAFGRIKFEAKASGALTRRSHLREDGPLRLRCPGAPSAELEAVIINTAGGIAGGDRLTLDISAGPGARLILTTAAAEKIYRSLAADSTITVALQAGPCSFLAWLPQETILFDGARLARTIHVDLAENAGFIFAESVVFGRFGMGETVRHGLLQDRWRIHRAGRILHAEALRLEGDVDRKLIEPAVAKGARAMATVMVVPGNDAAVAAVRALKVCGELAASAWKGMMLVRLCAADGATLRCDLIAVLRSIGGLSLPRLWLN